MTSSFFSTSWLTLAKSYKKLWVAFSGGMDSTVLLHNLIKHREELPPIQAIHINHGISKNALFWQEHCQSFCAEQGILLITESVEFDRSKNKEAEARKARYAAFSKHLELDHALVLAHHQDDQAETLLLQLFRGAGIEGLSAMSEISSLSFGTLLRPLLNFSRKALENYAIQHNLLWIEDESNQDCNYNRNFIRHTIFPALEERWEAVMPNIARAAKHCQEARLNLDNLAKGDLKELSPVLDTSLFENLSEERKVNCLRFWIKANQVPYPSSKIFDRIIKEVLEAKRDAQPQVSWAGFSVQRFREKLYLRKAEEPKALKPQDWLNFPEPLVLGDGRYLQVEKSKAGLKIPENSALRIAYRKGGELFYWRGQHKCLKKLLQEWKIPPWEREAIPLLYIGDTLAAVIGYAISDHYFTKEEGVYQLILSELPSPSGRRCPKGG